MSAEIRGMHLVIHGRVQGVWYRDSMRSEALRLGISGWCRNRKDGTVEAHMEGEVAALEALLAWCRVGPPLAEVARVEVEDGLPGGLPGGFRIEETV